MKSKHGFDTSEERSKLMGKIKATGTKAEVLLRKRLWNKGIRYRKNNKNILGCPDISIKKDKIAIFVDGEFWHGFNWKEKKKKIKSNREYWIKKIEGNIQRDSRTNKTLRKEGWVVIRIWEHEIKKNLDVCIKLIMKNIEKVSSKSSQRGSAKRRR